MVLSDFSGPEGGHRPQRDTQTDDPFRVIPIWSYQPVSATLAIAATVSVSVVIPARNEAANLPHVFASLPTWVDEIIVVDGHSVDDTVAVTRELCSRARVIAQVGRGKGDALQAGFNAATGDIIVSMDADGSTDGAEIIQFVGALLTGADFAKGSRFSGSGGSEDITPIRRTGNRVLGMLVNRMFRTQFTDLCYGYNAFWARHLEALHIDCTGFEVETLMNIRAAKAGLRIQEVPSIERPRLYGESNLSAIGDGWRILRLIAQEKFSWLGRRLLAAPPRPVSSVQPATPQPATPQPATPQPATPQPATPQAAKTSGEGA